MTDKTKRAIASALATVGTAGLFAAPFRHHYGTPAATSIACVLVAMAIMPRD